MNHLLKIAMVLLLVSSSSEAAIQHLYGAYRWEVSDHRGQTVQIADDGLGGAFVTWVDDATVNGYADPQPFVNHFNSFGRPLWSLDVNFSPWSHGLMSASDGANGVYMVWATNVPPAYGYDYNLYAARLDGNENIIWGKTRIHNSDEGKNYLKDMFTDSDGNFYVVYTRCRNSGDCGKLGSSVADLWALKVSPTGTVLFRTLIKESIYAPNSNSGMAGGIIDGNGGVFVSWHDTSDGKIYLIRLDGSGDVEVGWPAEGFLIQNHNPAWEWQSFAYIARSSDGYTYVGINYRLPGSEYRVRFLKLDENGSPAPVWGSTGIDLTLPNKGFIEKILPDNENGFYYIGRTTETFVNGQGYHGRTFLQRVQANGTIAPEWTTLKTIDDSAWSIDATMDSLNDVYLHYADVTIGADRYYYVTKYLSNGVKDPLWNPNIILSTDSSGFGFQSVKSIPDSGGGVIMGFGKKGSDIHGLPPTSVLAQRFNENIPLVLGDILCDEGDGFVNCTNARYMEMITAVGAECADEDWGVDYVDFRLIDPDMIERASGWYTQQEGDFYSLQGLNVPVDKGGAWRLRATCHGFPIETTSRDEVWEINSNLPPIISSIECDSTGSENWGDCTSLVFEETVYQTRTECTDPENALDLVTLSMTNPASSEVFNDNAVQVPGTDFWVLDHSDVPLLFEGLWLVDATCVDNESQSDYLQEQWIISATPGGENIPPSANAGGDVFTWVGIDVNVDGSASHDPDGTIVAWLWELNDTTDCILNGQQTDTFNVMCTEETTRLAILTVWDDGGLSDSDEASITILPPGAPPITPTPDPGGDGGLPGEYQEASVLSLACPRITASDHTRITVQCIVEGKACSGVVLSGAPHQLEAVNGNVFRYIVDTPLSINYEVRASSGVGSDSCDIQRTGIVSSRTPEWHPIMILFIIGIVSLIVRKRISNLSNKSLSFERRGGDSNS
ncbi:PKD domain-containing protein [Candidatus Micrarchaeota archaeon]|nr:PKD domain-containing protein [Candidatus Micrarchaeota archaeon]